MKRAIGALVLLTSVSVFAHELRPAYLEVREEQSGEFSVLWKTPMLGDARLALAQQHEMETVARRDRSLPRAGFEGEHLAGKLAAEYARHRRLVRSGILALQQDRLAEFGGVAVR